MDFGFENRIWGHKIQDWGALDSGCGKAGFRMWPPVNLDSIVSNAGIQRLPGSPCRSFVVASVFGFVKSFFIEHRKSCSDSCSQSKNLVYLNSSAKLSADRSNRTYSLFVWKPRSTKEVEPDPISPIELFQEEAEQESPSSSPTNICISFSSQLFFCSRLCSSRFASIKL